MCVCIYIKVLLKNIAYSRWLSLVMKKQSFKKRWLHQKVLMLISGAVQN